MENKGKIIWNIVKFILAVAVIVVAWNVYQMFNFNAYTKAEYHLGTSTFMRDSEVKYGSSNSYKIQSDEFNDAMFSKTIEVVPNTSYRVKCKIKTKDVVAQDIYADVGAHICIGNTFEKSDNVIGTKDWTEVEFCFNSKNREKVDIGFRLGGTEGEAKGTAWYTDFSIEAGVADTSNTWNFLCLLFDNVDVDMNGKNIKLELTTTNKEDISNCMTRFKKSMEEMSLGKMKINYDIFEVTTPITHFSKDTENGYYVSGYDVRNVLDPYIKEGKYDHIFIVFRTGDMGQKEAIPVSYWIGLGSMQYRGLGYSNIRLPDDDNTYLYKYDVRANIFPEEVFVHEFLHTLERNADEYGYDRPVLHNNAEYNYPVEILVGLKKWYQDYMNKEIKTQNGK